MFNLNEIIEQLLKTVQQLNNTLCPVSKEINNNYKELIFLVEHLNAKLSK